MHAGASIQDVSLQVGAWVTHAINVSHQSFSAGEPFRGISWSNQCGKLGDERMPEIVSSVMVNGVAAS